jgi:rhodanese-related sulfurtransferase
MSFTRSRPRSRARWENEDSPTRRLFAAAAVLAFELPDQPLLDSLCIDRDDNVIVPLRAGQVVAAGAKR